ncbi:hypothetical protein BP00DRAFT_341932 [Aspergillus indologenus CBS 114.80]|uniref:Sex determining protein n=1 Tax=Aspergillus indologenus CBS 114.80 TaxID=1450541 RepID=A0A2V5J4B9_9EURO|nr:hypothetical protein BP00DRAFT_341932 [Aspergillus indologenus CBS 114.80]
MSMYPWHGSTATASTGHPAAAAAASNPRIDSAATTITPTAASPSTSASALQMPQMPWLPSMISARANPQHATLPNLSTNLRIRQQPTPQPTALDTQQQHQHHSHPHSLPRHSQQKQQQQPSDFDTSDCSVRQITAADALGDQDYVSSDGMGANTIAHGLIPNGDATTTRPANTTTTILIDDRDDLDLDAAAAGNDSPRKHGKRLTTLEEVSLFDICNRHAHEFGQRSNLCKWWMTVTEEFTRDQGHPYSWHSVRRKVELVTKQRMKFLDEQRERGGSESDDRSNLRWRAAVDAWIPTWQRWEEAEARRIEKRDSRRPRKRKDREWEVWVNGNNDGVSPGLGAWRAMGSVSGSGSPLVNVGGAAAQLPTPSQQALSTPPASTPQHTKVRLPPGFDNMFASQPQSQYHTPTPVPATMLGGAASSRGEAGNAESSSMMSAVLETLGKLNRHLDAANSSTTPTSSKTNKTSDSRSRMSQASSLPIPTHLIATLKAELREEMREEMRSELAKDRASLEEKLDSVQRTQEMILEMLRQEPS